MTCPASTTMPYADQITLRRIMWWVTMMSLASISKLILKESPHLDLRKKKWSIRKHFRRDSKTRMESNERLAKSCVLNSTPKPSCSANRAIDKTRHQMMQHSFWSRRKANKRFLLNNKRPAKEKVYCFRMAHLILLHVKKAWRARFIVALMCQAYKPLTSPKGQKFSTETHKSAKT